jgi:hypothetical protein
MTTIYQQSGDAKKPYFVQYSAVVEDSPVKTSWTKMNNNILIKKIPKLLNSHFNAFLIEFFLASVDNIIKSDCILFYSIIIVISQNENCKNVYKITTFFNNWLNKGRFIRT